jgi:hypothetical protein
MSPVIDVRPASSRFHTRLDWLDSWHSFSFSTHHDPENTHHGLLLVSNDDVVAPSTGFGTHAHRDMEIVTWVVRGRLEHRDSEGNHAEIYPGLAQRMSAGRGIQHSEMNPDPSADVRLIQMWVRPDTEGIDPGYEQLDINSQLDTGSLVPIASGAGHDGAIRIHQRGAVLWGGRLRAGTRVALPDGHHVHLFVVSGTPVLAGDHPLGSGDAVRLTDAGSPVVDAGPSGAEVLVWVTD